MELKKSSEAREFASLLVTELKLGTPESAYEVLQPVLIARTPFRLLDIIGARLDACHPKKTDMLLGIIADQSTEGGWVVIASCLRERIPVFLENSISSARKYISQADIWYACDIFGERVLGQALVDRFGPTINMIEDWRTDPNRWVRRALGVAGHFWAKRTKCAPEKHTELGKLLSFYQPMLSEKQLDAAKGIGWALKTMGRYAPGEIFTYVQVNYKGMASVIRRKALKFIPADLQEKP